MIEFKSVVYLDYQKTGTTSIVEFLRSVLNEVEVEHGAHDLPVSGHDVTKLHFISVRNPLSMYISLFSHGAGQRGGLRKTLEKAGYGYLYEPTASGFIKWLDFMLNEENAPNLFRKYNRFEVRKVCGPLTYRLLMLSMIDALDVMRSLSASKEEVAAVFNSHRLFEHYIRTEHLITDLFTFWPVLVERSRVRRVYRSIDGMEKLSGLVPKKNASAKIDGLTPAIVPNELKARVREREWLIYETFGYDQHEKGAPPPLPKALT